TALKGLSTSVNKPSGAEGSLDPIYALTVYAIENAKESIDIANAYFILTPALEEALVAALERGVEVRIITNSMQSIDEPMIALPIIQSVAKLAQKGAKVFLKKGQTLHTKMLRVDQMAWLGSY